MSDNTTQYENLIGTTVSHYVLNKIIGSGAMGVVYLAKDIKLNRNVVIKVLKKEVVTQDKSLVKRFKAEAENIAALKHPNIIDVYSYDKFDDYHYIEMEYIQGNKLSELIRNNKLTYQVCVNLMYIICKAIQYSHDNGILHRDIKPSNIMITNSKELKIIDFGLSKNLNSMSHTQSNTMLGTPLYMSLECFDDAANATEKSDVYSLGVLFYELLTKLYPHNGATYSELYRSLIINKPKKPKEHNNDIHPEIDILIMSMIKKDMNSRVDLKKVISILEKHINFQIPCEYYENIEFVFNKNSGKNSNKSTVLMNTDTHLKVSEELYVKYLSCERCTIYLAIIFFIIFCCFECYLLFLFDIL